MNPNIEKKVNELMSIMKQEAEGSLPQAKACVELGDLEVAISVTPSTGKVHFQVRKWIGDSKRCAQVDFSMDDLPDGAAGGEYPRFVLRPAGEKSS